MAAQKRKAVPVPAVAGVALAGKLIAKLESAYRNGTLKPINPNAKAETTAIRVMGEGTSND